MAIPHFISSKLSQTLVYWANPVNDGQNFFTYDAPVEIKGRIEMTTELIATKDGEEMLSTARVYLAQEVADGEYICHSTLAVVGSSAIPSTTDNAMRVLSLVKTPRLGSATEYIYKAYLHTRYDT